MHKIVMMMMNLLHALNFVFLVFSVTDFLGHGKLETSGYPRSLCDVMATNRGMPRISESGRNLLKCRFWLNHKMLHFLYGECIICYLRTLLGPHLLLLVRLSIFHTHFPLTTTNTSEFKLSLYSLIASCNKHVIVSVIT